MIFKQMFLLCDDHKMLLIKKFHGNLPLGLRGAPGYSLDQAHHLPIEMDPLIGMLTRKTPFHES